MRPSIQEITVKKTSPLRMLRAPMDRPDSLKFAHFPALNQAISCEQAAGPTPLRILDVGCGPGNLALLCKVPAACSLFGVDLWPNQLRQAAEKDAYEVLFQVNLVHGLPFVNDSFDMIVCSEVLMYLPEATKTLAELYRVLAPGGKLFVYNPINWLPGLHSQIKRLTRKIYQERRSIALDCQSHWRDTERANRITYYSYQSLIDHIRSVNFQVTEIRGFRLFRNRIRLMRLLEKFDWYRRLVLVLTRYYPPLASDLFVAAYKEAVVEMEPVCLEFR
jgi:ubiquinone/menaquinone biosynthesis C-methylase UbiE